MKFINIIAFLVLSSFISACSTQVASNNDTVKAMTTDEPYFRFETTDGRCGYKSAAGDTLIKPGKYDMCFTDTFTYAAIVMKPDEGFFGVDKSGAVLYQVFVYDNGPDYLAEGLFRIKKNGKIGYANHEGRVVIEPQFACAYPFENGKAKVSLDCKTLHDGEHTGWESSAWFYIDKTGKRIE